MGRLIVWLSLAGIAILEAGSFLFPSFPIMWLASTHMAFEIARAMVMGALLILLLLNQFSQFSWLVRLNVCMLAAAGLVAIAVLTYQGIMPLMDSWTLAGASVSMAILVLDMAPARTYSKTCTLLPCYGRSDSGKSENLRITSANLESEETYGRTSAAYTRSARYGRHHAPQH